MISFPIALILTKLMRKIMTKSYDNLTWKSRLKDRKARLCFV